MSSPRILLRASSGSTTGLGHVVRTVAVSHALRHQGANYRLIVDDRKTVRWLGDRGVRAECEADDPSWPREPYVAAWLDGFRDWSEELRLLREVGVSSWLVENRTPARDLAGGVIYPALHYRPDAWDLARPERVFGGAEWIPLLPEVVERHPVERVEDLVISFGGSDPHHLTERSLQALGKFSGRIVIVVGTHMRQREEALRRVADGLPDARVDSSPGTSNGSIASIFARSRVALTAVGTSLYELAYLGTPALVLANYADDADALEYYASNGPHLALGAREALSDAELTERLLRGWDVLRSRPFRGVPGLGAGAERIASLLRDRGRLAA